MLHFIVNTIRRIYHGFNTKTNKQYASDKHNYIKGGPIFNPIFVECSIHDKVADATQALLCKSKQSKLKTKPDNTHIP
jgi:hypothetical protein